MARIVSGKRLYDVFPDTGIEFLAAAEGSEIDEADYDRLVKYNKKRGTPGASAAPEDAPVSYEDMKTRAAALGIEFKANVGRAKLAPMIAAKEAEDAAAADQAKADVAADD